MLKYKVEEDGLDAFFILFDFSEDEEDDIRDQVEAGARVWVYQNGSVRLSSSEELVAPSDEGEMVDTEAFEREARKCESVAELAGTDEDVSGFEDEELELSAFEQE